MNKARKIITLLAMVSVALEIIVVSTYAWFYFPNAKGLEMDSAPAVNVAMKLYRSNGTSFEALEPSSYRVATSKDFANSDFISNQTYYELVETQVMNFVVSEGESEDYYVKSAGCYTKIAIDNQDDFAKYDRVYTLSATEAETYDSSKTYYIPSYAIEEKYEFFQWGDEYICEDEDATHYYALECICDSEACTDGYIKSVLNANLECLGAFMYNTTEKASASIPVFEASYKYSALSNVDLSTSSALVEAKAQTTTVVEGRTSSYVKFLNGKYYTMNGSNYVEANSYSSGTYYMMDISETYIANSDVWNAKGCSSQNLYYYDNGSYIPTNSFVTGKTSYYTLSNIEATSTLSSFANGAAKTTIDDITGINSFNIENQIVMNRFYSNNTIDGLDSTQYVHDVDANHTTSYIRFVIYIKIEPDEDYITSYMSKNSTYTEDASSSEIIISNTLSLDMVLRTVPKYTTYPEE